MHNLRRSWAISPAGNAPIRAARKLFDLEDEFRSKGLGTRAEFS
jgi:hypothetical protein